ncbi:TetR family transcriptional regulator [Mycolicibacterium mageritense DSM 44476 = CIP 104973]|uniref:HTH-type transcriptional regulator BetI n=1 Tax=Mycolicibacterium mageritense TaxID=53462 RepID=A0AAI8TS20_MYCME|nr:TetR/AcrR family transcriptional regulator [Mycolicibacterium mageritense]MBN3455980.1 TetR/AcrR family transcriptional regulator [Mycobacterium sp. DSM 3803]OKH73497.1 TetR family transcriptional regulator [Mycobacterium sp. SWH-M3]MCC9180924.1 TetR/AcrR family transcriptional regulator [Mycolicibacterium mageritense]TXI57686.1 MAG: TetR/AcrR family transcriptional regulator [Mycolicibacterium mageritense]CDO22517.1 TetR family transcriptional regulator [Mycolicibacterium mageritense DSM 4
MPATRAAKDKDAGTRRRLIEATAQVIRDEGYAAATTRRIAAEAGVRSALVYYYFDTLDDLFVAVLRSGADAALARMREAIDDDDPLRALWLLNSDSRLTGLNTEFMALANHRKAIGAELKAYSERVRDIETTAMAMVLRAHGVDTDEFPPVVMSMLLTQSARSLCNEEAVGVTQGHAEFRAFVDRMLSRFAPLK